MIIKIIDLFLSDYDKSKNSFFKKHKNAEILFKELFGGETSMIEGMNMNFFELCFYYRINDLNKYFFYKFLYYKKQNDNLSLIHI